jgi:hypothetical protein
MPKGIGHLYEPPRLIAALPGGSCSLLEARLDHAAIRTVGDLCPETRRVHDGSYAAGPVVLVAGTPALTVFGPLEPASWCIVTTHNIKLLE